MKSSADEQGDMKGKKRSEQHLIDADGARLLQDCLPRHWVMREYRPDYGLDYSIEVFDDAVVAKGASTYETLGEHFFVQLKSVSKASARPLKLYGRGNVEKGRERLNKRDLVGELKTIRQAIDVPELVTINRIGVGMPVLLVVADLATRRCHLVCLNDYIDKVLIPRYYDWTAARTRTIHVPIANEITKTGLGLVALRWYAKRVKLFSAFQRFIFQEGELEHIDSVPELTSLAKVFASRLVQYDFWNSTEMWAVIAHYGSAVKQFLLTGSSGLMQRVRTGEENAAVADGELKAFLYETEIRQLWKSLALLARTYEDVCREWFLPTGLGYVSSYGHGPHSGSAIQNAGRPKIRQ